MTMPNTFVVGCAKAGTTAVCSWLRYHDEAFVPALKEPDWFASDLGLAPFRGIHDRTGYLALFAAATDRHRVVVDGSPSSLLSEVAAPRIAYEAPGARIVISIRDPVEVVHALHSQTVVAGLQPIDDFDAAVRAAMDPAMGAPDDPLQTWNRYLDVVRLEPQLQRYFDAFPRERIHVIRFDRLRDDPESTWAELQTFLGLTHRPLPTTDAVNPNTEPVFPALQRLAYHPRSRLRRVARRAVPPRARRSMRDAVYRSNVRQRPRRDMSDETRRMILAEIEPDVRALGRLVGWDVDDWLAPRPPSG